MRNIHILLIFILVLIIPSISFSETYSISPGIHTFVAKPECSKCHSEIQPLLSTEHSEIECSGCHNKHEGTHSATNISCSNCHTPKMEDIHQTNYPNCIECHISHGALRYDYHNNATFMRTHPCMSCHAMRR